MYKNKGKVWRTHLVLIFLQFEMLLAIRPALYLVNDLKHLGDYLLSVH